jgi:fructoselysine 6-phosphate deglycase
MVDLPVTVKPFDPDFVTVVAGAAAQRGRAQDVVEQIVKVRELSNVYFVGCGGSLYATYPVKFLLETTSDSLDVFHLTSNEFNFRRPKRLGRHSLVVVASHSGRTKETLAAIDSAHAGDAAVLGVTRSAESQLATRVDEAFTYGSEETVWEPKQVLLANLGHALLKVTNGGEDATAICEAYDALGPAVLLSLQANEPQLHEVAEQLQDEPVIYVLGAGPIEGVARCLAMCYLQEMQWMNAAAFNAGEFFHGAFEVVTDDVPVVVYAGEDATRPMAERAIDFCRRYTKKLHVVDSRDFGLPGVPASMRGEVAPILLGASVSRLAKHLEAVRGHDLKLRRYMFKVDY